MLLSLKTKKETLLFYIQAARNGKFDIVKYLQFNVEHYGTLPLVQYLIEKHQCNVQGCDNFGTTPLIQAVTSGKIDIMKYLISERGCDPMGRGLHWTPLH